MPRSSQRRFAGLQAANFAENEATMFSSVRLSASVE
jgi:hypothetical protein